MPLGQAHAPRPKPVGIVRCPGCTAPMIVMNREPRPGADGLVDITYRCQTCGTETMRTIKDRR